MKNRDTDPTWLDKSDMPQRIKILCIEDDTKVSEITKGNTFTAVRDYRTYNGKRVKTYFVDGSQTFGGIGKHFKASRFVELTSETAKILYERD